MHSTMHGAIFKDGIRRFWDDAIRSRSIAMRNRTSSYAGVLVCTEIAGRVGGDSGKWMTGKSETFCKGAAESRIEGVWCILYIHN